MSDEDLKWLQLIDVDIKLISAINQMVTRTVCGFFGDFVFFWQLRWTFSEEEDVDTNLWNHH